MSQPETHLQPYISQADEHQWLAYLGGGELGVVLDGAITGGQLTVIDAHGHRGDASPVHVHTRDDEAFLLLDGRMTVWIGDQRWQLQPGGVVFLPRNIPHAVRYDIASRALVLSVPGACIPLGRLGPEPAETRRLAHLAGSAPAGRRAGWGQIDRPAARARGLTV